MSMPTKPENHPARKCADPHCASPGLLQDVGNFFPIRSKDGSVRYDSVCKKCRMRRQSERRRRKRSVRTALWADAILRGLKQEYGKQGKLLDDRLTASVLVAVMELQHQTCAVTGTEIKLPSDDDIRIIGYTEWRRSLSEQDGLRLPRLVAVFPDEAIKIGTMFFIVEGAYSLYQLFGAQGMAGVTLKAPVIHQYDAILKHMSRKDDAHDAADTSVR